MSKHHTALKKQFKEEKAQEELKQQYGITQENVVVVERKSRIVQMWRATLNYAFFFFSIMVRVAIAVLAIIGLTTLIFPDIRVEFISAMQTAISEVKAYVGI